MISVYLAWQPWGDSFRRVGLWIAAHATTPAGVITVVLALVVLAAILYLVLR